MVSQQNQNVFYETNLLHETFPTGQANKKYFQIITVIIPQIYTRNRDTSLLFKPLSCFFFLKNTSSPQIITSPYFQTVYEQCDTANYVQYINYVYCTLFAQYGI